MIQRDVRIALSDGTALAADLWLPSAHACWPTLISCTAYRKDDLAGAGSEAAHRYFTKRGYACLLVDLRGLGGSDGEAYDPADPQEGRDGADVVEWAARQPWSNGRVGMWGMSWGAITTFWTAAAQPPHLQATATIMGFLDAYHDWLYPGGCPTCLVPLAWACQHLVQQLMPSPSLDWTEGSRARWRDRLEHLRLYLPPLRAHPTYDAFWRERTIPVEQVQVPTFLIGGWRDMCCAGIIRAYERLAVPRKLIMGPWGHTFPDVAPTEPIDYLSELCRWWDRWLRDAPEEAEEAPVALYVQGAGRWRHERSWPLRDGQQTSLWLGEARGLVASPPGDGGHHAYPADPTVGVASGRWDGLGIPDDQAADDARSLTYTSEPLRHGLSVIGAPRLDLAASLEEGQLAHLAVRLCDVQASGVSELITSGWSKIGPSSDPGGRLTIALWPTAYLVPAGHRLRLSISCADFPHMWPTSVNPRLRVYYGGDNPSVVHVPVALPTEVRPRGSPSLPRPRADPAPMSFHSDARRRIETDAHDADVTVTSSDYSSSATPAGGRTEVRLEATARVQRDRPQDAAAHARGNALIATPLGHHVDIEATISASRARLTMSGNITIDGTPFFARDWQAGAVPES